MRPRPRSDPKSIDLDQLVIAAGKLAKTVRNKGGTAMARIVMKPSPGRRGEISEVTEKEVEMDRISRIQWRALSRRAVVVRSLACAAGAAASLAPVEKASAKMAQKIAEYQETPKGDQQCSNCNLFQEPNACTLVDGEISPAGWCKLWVKKAG